MNPGNAPVTERRRARIYHCLTCRCAVYSAVDAARHEVQGHNIVSYLEEE